MMTPLISFMRKAASGGGGGSVTLAHAGAGANHFSAKTDTTHTSRSATGLSIPNSGGGKWIAVIGVCRFYGSTLPSTDEAFGVTLGGSAVTNIAGRIVNLAAGHSYFAFAGTRSITGVEVDVGVSWTTSTEFSRLWFDVYELTGYGGGAITSNTTFASASTFSPSVTAAEGDAVLAAAYSDNDLTGVTVVTQTSIGPNLGDGQLTGALAEASAGTKTPVFTQASSGNGGAIAISLAA